MLCFGEEKAVGVREIWLHLPRTCYAVPIIPGGGRKISPNSAPSHSEVWTEAEGLVRCLRLTHCSTDHLLVPFSACADALLSQVQTSKTCIAFCFPSAGISRVIPEC